MFKGVRPAKSAQTEQAIAGLVYGKRLLWGRGPRGEQRPLEFLQLIKPVLEEDRRETEFSELAEKWEASE